MNIRSVRRRGRVGAAFAIALSVVAAGCGDDDAATPDDTATQSSTASDESPATLDDTGSGNGTSGSDGSDEVLHVSAIPDQDPEQLQRLYGTVADYLSDELDVDVEYVPVTDYAASVNLFRAGDLDLVWFGGLTGVQARLQTPGATAVVQRDIDAEFHSVFIANTDTAIEPFTDVAGLTALEDTRFTFGSESSTSGRLMPEYYFEQAGLSTDDFDGAPGFSESHDATIELVESGTYDAGVLNEQVWKSRLADGSVDRSKVVELFRTPAYYDYHWVLRPDVDERFGDGFTERVVDAFLALDRSDHRHAEILDLFGADAFIETSNENYAVIEEVGRELGLVN